MKTVTCAVPAAAMSLAGIEAVNCVLLTKVVVRSLPFQRTTEPDTKFVPVTVRVKAAPPADALEGERLASVGAGLLMVKVRALEGPTVGTGFNTVTCAVPAVATSVAGIEAVNCVLLTKVVVRSLPSQRTTALEMKFEPFTVRVKAAAPANTPDGEREVSAGSGLLMVKVRELEPPPPGAGLNTVTWAVPAAAMSPTGITAVNCVLLT